MPRLRWPDSTNSVSDDPGTIQIRDELLRCDLFVPLLSKDFLKSKWALQEVGFIASRSKVMIAPLSIDETIPFGFLSHLQSGHIPVDGVTRELLVEPLVRQFPRTIIPSLIRIIGAARSFRSAEALMASLFHCFHASRRKRRRHWPRLLSAIARYGLPRGVGQSTFPTSFAFREETSSP